MPDNCQKHLQLHSLQLQTMLFQWGLPATFAGAIWGKVTVFICQHISVTNQTLQVVWRVAQTTHLDYTTYRSMSCNL